ncbi:MAG TPA: NADH-quinone oxidoreductase subunit NuoK [Thermodesulfovibrionales bacterium]|nr:NADH-quinone oxidoreductase subunit NuoK [Thermodesulfovibrionales bacterium]
MIPSTWYIWLSAAVFAIGVAGFVTRRNIIIMFMSIELMLNAANISLVSLSYHMNDMRGQIFVFFIIAVAAAEAAIGLAIIIALFRNRATTNVDEVNEMKG